MKLSAVRARSETKPGRYNDGNGLYLLVRPDGRKGWVLRYRLGTKQRDMGLGSYPEVSLATARQSAAEAREKLRSGEDPITARKVGRAALARQVQDAEQRSFQVLAERYIAKHEATWRNPKHRQQWKNTLATYAYPQIGKQDVAQIDRADVLAILEPIWTKTPETASRLRGRIETILDFAASDGLREATNPARLADLRHALPNVRKLQPVENQPALPWRKLPAFMAELRKRPATAARALEFLILTAARTNEVMGATWHEIDEEHGIWTIPGKRMKSGRQHRVALSSAALAILKQMAPLRKKSDDYVFPGPRPKSPLSSMAFLMLLRRMQGPKTNDKGREHPPVWADQDGRPITAHGFRATFRTWAGDATEFPREVVEAALAHTIKDRAEAAYARGDLLDRRRALMEAWVTYVGPQPSDPLVMVPGRAQ
ncbi:tyrosine-type recombinase/integrase [Geminicoccus roseus]|uniref:tyrosine-type recombinase/integrase n=1 Tax=Geminicoccus roseus TaxID=404900 RepID=UPI0003F7B377|nr:integrase arm-type DNA-binding domain-containing protein [Geminicoccus roseus]